MLLSIAVALPVVGALLLLLIPNRDRRNDGAIRWLALAVSVAVFGVALALWARFGQGQGLATRVYYRELAAAFERERPRLGEHASPAVDELRRVVDAITALAEEHQGPDSRVLLG